MAPAKLNSAERSTKTGRNKWDTRQRTVLHVLHTHFNFNESTRLSAFNAFFKDHLLRHGLPDGLSQRAFTAQYAERRRKLRIWAGICAAPSTDHEWQERSKLTKEITQIAMSLAEQTDPGDNSRDEIPCTPENHPVPMNAGAPSQEIQTEQRAENNASPSKRSVRTLAKTTSFTEVVQMSSAPTSAPSSATTTGVEAASSQRTPANRRKDATVYYRHPSGYSMYLRPAEYEETQEDFVPVSEAAAHPTLSPLLFRYWSDGSQSKLKNGEFRAARFPFDDIPIPPMSDLDDTKHFPWNELFYHLNGDKVHSPFISTSNYFFWILRLALKSAAHGVTNGKITSIDTTKLEPKNVYYVPPFHRELCKKRAFRNGAQYYRGCHEFMIYCKIPSEAILTTVTVQEVLDLASRVPSVKDALRFQLLEAPGAYRGKLRPILKADNIELTAGITTAIGRVAKLLGLTPFSPREQITHIIQDIVQGWALKIDYASPEEWALTAAVFAHVFCRRSIPTAGVNEQQLVKQGFLDGVAWGLGTFNTRHNPEDIQRMKRNADAVGLGCIAQILSDELHTTDLDIWSYHHRQERMLQSLVRPVLATPLAIRVGGRNRCDLAGSRSPELVVPDEADDQSGDNQDGDEDTNEDEDWVSFESANEDEDGDWVNLASGNNDLQR